MSKCLKVEKSGSAERYALMINTGQLFALYPIIYAAQVGTTQELSPRTPRRHN